MDSSDIPAMLERPAGIWVELDVAMLALGITDRSHAYRIARTEGWRTAPAQRPRQYAFEDIARTHRARSGS